VHKPYHHKRLLLCDVKRRPQLPAVMVLRAATSAVIPALLHAHPAVVVSKLSTSTDSAADDVVRLAQRLRLALDNYRRILLDDDQF
jgi:hypothetical protein